MKDDQLASSNYLWSDNPRPTMRKNDKPEKKLGVDWHRVWRLARAVK
jgi:hypothetical protein